MITRIELIDFMSHTRTVIEPAPGLTVLVGPNNVGKSAVVAALKILCQNDKSTYVTRHGAKECAVLVQTDDGHTIEWRRKTSPSYLVDGQKFDRLGIGRIPDELHAALRLPMIADAGAAEFDIHFGCQKSPIFLLNDPPSVAARFFASSSDATLFVAMQKRHKEKLDRRQRDRKSLEAESRLLNAELEALEPIVEVEGRLQKVEASYKALCDEASRLAVADRRETALRRQSGITDYYQCRARMFDRLAPPPALAPLEPLRKVIGAMTAANREARFAARQAEACKPLVPPPPLHDVWTLLRLNTELQRVHRAADRAGEERSALADLGSPPPQAETDALARLIARRAQVEQDRSLQARRRAALAGVQPAPPIAEVAPLAGLTAALEQATQRRDQWDAASRALQALPDMPRPSGAADLEQLISRLDVARGAVESQAECAAALAAELATVRDDVRQAVAGQACPTCGAPLDAERVLARAGGLPGGHDHG